MSIESFHAAYPPTGFATSMRERRDFGYPTKIQYIANMYRVEGSNGVREIDKKYGKGLPLPRPDDVGKSISAQDQRSLTLNLSGIFFGLSLRAIEKLLIEKEFDRWEYVSLLAESLRGTLRGKGFVVPDEAPRPIYRRQWEDMIEVAKKDPTLAAFFEKGMAALPLSLQRFILNPGGENEDMYEVIRGRIVPEYKLRVRGLLPTKPLRAT